MISFKQYLSKFNKKYVCVSFTDETNKSLREYALKNGFDLSVKYNDEKQDPNDFKFHMTIIYTSNRLNAPNGNIEISNFNVQPNKLELLGENKNIPVIKIKLDNKLKEIREFFTELGFKDNWPSYKPHISLSYKRQLYDLSKIELPDFPIEINSLTIKNQ